MKRPVRAAGAGAAAVAGIVAALAGYTAVNARLARRRAPPTGRFVTVEGAKLHVVEMGQGAPIVLVHGLGGQLRNFTYALAGRLASLHRVVLIDRPGSGYSTLADGADRGLRGQAAIVARAIATLGLDRPLLVGHSLGGAVALAVAIDHPGSVRGLALIAPLTRAVETIPPAFRALMIPSPVLRWLVAWTVAAPLARLGRAQARAMVFGPEPVVEDFEGRGGGALALRPSAVFAASSEVCYGTHELAWMAERYPALAMPVGILFGRGDRILDPELQGETTAAAIPGAMLTMIEGGHMIPLTQPDAVARWIGEQI